MTTIQQSDHACPVCEHHLLTEQIEDGRYAAWCPFGPCQSTKANDGAEGETRNAACLNLFKILEQE